MKSLKFIKRQIQIVIEDSKTRRVEGFMQVFINGKTGIFYALIGKDVIESVVANIDNIFTECEIDNILAVMEPPVISKIENEIKETHGNRYCLSKIRETEFSEKEMLEIRIGGKEEQ